MKNSAKTFNKFFLYLYLVLIPIKGLAYYDGKDLIIVNKKNVMHKFVKFDGATDDFVSHKFLNWENETFDIFDAVKDSQGVAIDLGAWIGTTSIWLSKNFYHVVAVDADGISLKCLKQNLEASECHNVSICERPVAQKTEKVIFGPRTGKLKSSMSYIKNEQNNNDDFVVRAITFKQLVHDYVYANPSIKERKIAFIKCDIEGEEENILEDMLYFAYYNKVKVYVSFHLSWWKSKKITDFEYLFKFFKSNCPQADICEYIQSNPFASLLFEPLDNAGTLIKKNVPVVVIGYNQITYIKNMVTQLEKYTSDIIVVDNNSKFKPLLDYYENDFKYTLLRQKENFGHKVYKKDFVQNIVGDVYILTDPDLQFNAKLPNGFIQTLIDISNYFKIERVGFALSCDGDDFRTDLRFFGRTVKEFENGYWIERYHYPLDGNLQLYTAPIDTTFCLINKNFSGKCIRMFDYPYFIRVAGDYTCLHLPWYKNFQSKLMEGELEAYTQGNISSTWLI